MRGYNDLRIRMRRVITAGVLVPACIFATVPSGFAQLGRGGSMGGTSRRPLSTSDPTGTNARMGLPPDADPSFVHRQMVSRQDDVKKHMTENAARLLALTRELQAGLRDHDPTDADVKRIDEIAKLAHTVRDQMRQ